jgi:hypothetical protein
MHDEEIVWTQEHETEVVILRAILTVVALRSQVDAQTFSRVPPLYDFIAAANAVAEEIGWGDEPPPED